MKNFVKMTCVLIGLYSTEILVAIFGYQHIKSQQIKLKWANQIVISKR